jgi:hypothetical protein
MVTSGTSRKSAPFQVGLAHLVRHGLVFIERRPGKLEGQIMLAQRDLDLHAGSA